MDAHRMVLDMENFINTRLNSGLGGWPTRWNAGSDLNSGGRTSRFVPVRANRPARRSCDVNKSAGLALQ